jgi:hypothetical protein
LEISFFIGDANFKMKNNKIAKEIKFTFFSISSKDELSRKQLALNFAD